MSPMQLRRLKKPPAAFGNPRRCLSGFIRIRKASRATQPKLWPPKNGSASIHGDPSAQEAIVVVKAADPEAAQDVQIKLHPNRIVVRRDADAWWQGVAVDEHSVTVRMADNTIIEIRHDGSVKRRSAEDETHVEADGSIFKFTEFAEAHMTGDGVEMTRRTEDRIATITADGVVDRARKR